MQLAMLDGCSAMRDEAPPDWLSGLTTRVLLR